MDGCGLLNCEKLPYEIAILTLLMNDSGLMHQSWATYGKAPSQMTDYMGNNLHLYSYNLLLIIGTLFEM